MASLFNIGAEFQALYEIANETEYNEDGVIVDNSLTMIDLFNELQGDLVEKCDNTNYIIKELKSDSDTLADEIKRLQAKKKAIDNKADRLKELVKNTILLSGETKLKGKFNYSVRNSEKYIYDDISLFSLDDEFIKTKQEIDKNKLKEFVKAGVTIEGLKIEDTTVLTVR